MGDWERIFITLLNILVKIVIVCISGFIGSFIFNKIDIVNNIDTINNFFTTYEKTVIAFSGIASVFVATVAIIISLRINKQQKNIQLKQLKLECYNLRYKSWYALSQIKYFLEIEEKIFNFLPTNIETKEYEKIINDVKNMLEYSTTFNEIKFFIPAKEYSNIDKLQEILKELCKGFINNSYSRNVTKENLDNIEYSLIIVKRLCKKLEKDLYLADINKII